MSMFFFSSGSATSSGGGAAVQQTEPHTLHSSPRIKGRHSQTAIGELSEVSSTISQSDRPSSSEPSHPGHSRHVDGQCSCGGEKSNASGLEAGT